MSLAVDQIRSRVTTRVLAALGSTWRESLTVYDLYPSYDTRQIEHLSLTVGVLSTDVQQPSRQVASVGMPAITRIGLRWSYRLRTDGMSSDYDAALVAEQLVAKALASCAVSPTSNPKLAPRITSLSRRVVTASDGTGTGTLLTGEILADVFHHYPIA